MRTSLLVTALTLASTFAVAEGKMSFLRPGTVQAEDIDVKKIRGAWIAIHEENGKWYLAKTKVTAASDTELGFIDIRTKHQKVVGLLKDEDLVEGQVESASLITDEHGNARSFLFGGKKYSLVVKAVRFKYYSPELNKTFDNIRNDVYFSDGNTSTLVYGGPKTRQSSDHPFVRWAGDIDRDGRPDIIADFDDDSQKNASLCVFLSGGTKNGLLLRKTGCQFFSG